MLIQLLVGSLVSAIAIIVHALATVGAISVARDAGRRHGTYPRLHLMGVMVATVLVLMLAHTVEIVVWSLSYALVGAAPAGSDLLYFAFVNYTTLGYGDVTPVKAWQLLGPMAAMNGILMFGWSDRRAVRGAAQDDRASRLDRQAGHAVQCWRSRLASFSRSSSTIWRWLLPMKPRVPRSCRRDNARDTVSSVRPR